jgi:hypothetical protein
VALKFGRAARCSGERAGGNLERVSADGLAATGRNVPGIESFDIDDVAIGADGAVAVTSKLG